MVVVLQEIKIPAAFLSFWGSKHSILAIFDRNAEVNFIFSVTTLPHHLASNISKQLVVLQEIKIPAAFLSFLGSMLN